MEKSAKNKMGIAPVLKLLVSMSLPAIASMLINALYNVIDAVYVSWYHKDAFEAVSYAFPLQTLIIAFAVGTGVGVNSLIARRLGAGQKEEAGNAAMHGLLLAVLNTLVFMAIGLFLAEPFINMYTDDPVIAKWGTEYAQCVLIFSLGVFVSINVEKTLQATGNMIFPMISMILGCVINLVLDPVLIFGFWFIPSMGVLGAAISTVFAQFCSMIFIFIVLFKKKHDINISFKGFKLSFKIVRSIYSVGLPSIIIQTINSVLVLTLNKILADISGTAVKVLGIYFKLNTLVFMPVFGLTQGMMPIVGYNYGAKKFKRVTDALKYSTVIAVGIMLIGIALFLLIPDKMLSAFSADSEMLEIGVPALRIICTGFIFAAVQIIIVVMFQAVGRGFVSLILSFLRQIVIIIPFAYIFSKFGLIYIWYAIPLSEVISIIVALILFYRFKNKTLSRL